MNLVTSDPYWQPSAVRVGSKLGFGFWSPWQRDLVHSSRSLSLSQQQISGPSNVHPIDTSTAECSLSLTLLMNDEGPIDVQPQLPSEKYHFTIRSNIILFTKKLFNSLGRKKNWQENL